MIVEGTIDESIATTTATTITSITHTISIIHKDITNVNTIDYKAAIVKESVIAVIVVDINVVDFTITVYVPAMTE